jgi:hypothetical protein
MPSPIRSRSKCPQCGGTLYYVRNFLSFLTGKTRRICLTSDCGFVDPRRFKVTQHGPTHGHTPGHTPEQTPGQT